MPFFKLLAVGEVALLVRSHMQRLQPEERRRLGDLVRRARSLAPEERDELRELVGRLEPQAFAAAAAGMLSPIGVPRRFRRRRE